MGRTWATSDQGEEFVAPMQRSEIRGPSYPEDDNSQELKYKS